MAEYRDQEDANSESEEVVRIPDAAESPAYMGLAAQYGLSDDLEIGSDPIQTTVEQEYQAYLRSPRTSKNINIIKYWEVISNFNVINFIITDQALP
jgi:hypothetical protein